MATGDVPFAVATDTAGSGRVPPALNGIVGFKPSRGLISTVGLVPACRSLDCISLIGSTVSDLAGVFDVVAAHDRRDPYTRMRRRDLADPVTLRVGLPPMSELEFFGDEPMRRAHEAARSRVERTFARTTGVPFGPFLAAGELLYQGPWVAERLTEFGDFVADRPSSVLPVIREILAGAAGYSAVDVFAAEHRLGELRAEVAGLWEEMDLLVLPALGTTFTIDEVLADPIATNTALGHYTHFGNLLDLCAAVVPAGLTSDGRPAALMVLGPALADDRVLGAAAALADAATAMPHTRWPATGSDGRTTLVVVGHHLEGQPRNRDLADCGGYLLARTTTSADYRLLKSGGDTPLPGTRPHAVLRRPDRGRVVVRPLRRRARHPGGLVALHLPRPGHPRRRQRPARLRRGRVDRDRPRRHRHHQPRRLAQLPGLRGRRPLTDGQPLAYPLVHQGACDVPDTRSPAPTRSSSTPTLPVHPHGLAHRAGGHRHAA